MAGAVHAVYTAVRGESYADIANKYGLTKAELYAYNNINPRLTHVSGGMQLRVRASAPATISYGSNKKVTAGPAPVRTNSSPAPANIGAPGPQATAIDPNANAYTIMLDILKSYNLGQLAGTLDGLLKQYGPDQHDIINLRLQDTDAWRQRFAGNETRRKLGLAVLAPGDYLSTEVSFAGIMSAAGMPRGFYDDPSDFAAFIGRGTSPAEISDRVNGYVKAARNTDPAYRSFLAQKYGVHLTDGDIAAWMMDSTRAVPLIQRALDASGIGAAAAHQGMDLSGSRAENFLDRGLSPDQVTSGYGQANQILGDTQKLGSIYHDPYSMSDAENEYLFQDASAQKKRLNLAQKETNSFGGASAVGSKSLSRPTNNAY